MQVIDLSHVLASGMPVFPGSPEVELERIANLEEEGYTETLIKITTHTGTHIDCGLHYIPGGFDTESAPDRFFGRGLVIDCRNLGRRSISRDYLSGYGDKIGRVDFVLLHTAWDKYWGKDAYFSGFPFPEPEAATFLATFPLRGVGIDAISLDADDTTGYPVHHTLLSAGMMLIENLTCLDQLPETGFYFSCLPLKIQSGDGSPVRAVAITTL
jgi:kynurenine formamidase